MNKKLFSYGLLIGGAIGVCTALTNAPSSGQEMRKQLKKNSQEVKEYIDELKHNLQDIKRSVTYLSKEGKETLSLFIKDVKISVQQWQSGISYNQENIQREVEDIQRTIEELESSIGQNKSS
ncbi:YtxH domain-containing protein [Bacillus sp. 2205SS5-2]|uniref:YtxH domain-containing protein n=1 Tax=Bacillus sp. 2205SS5-2 TaxID=3109031 RepID=UPI00300560BF